MPNRFSDSAMVGANPCVLNFKACFKSCPRARKVEVAAAESTLCVLAIPHTVGKPRSEHSSKRASFFHIATRETCPANSGRQREGYPCVFVFSLASTWQMTGQLIRSRVLFLVQGSLVLVRMSLCQSQHSCCLRRAGFCICQGSHFSSRGRQWPGRSRRKAASARRWSRRPAR